MTSLLPRRILVGISCEPDASSLRLAEADRHTLQQAIWLAVRIGAEVRAVHVTDFVDARVLHEKTDIETQVRESLEPDLQRLHQAVAREGVTLDTAWRVGRPWKELIYEAYEHGSDLMMVSPRRDDVRLHERLLHGSTTRRLLRKAPCSVWVVEPDQPPEVKRIVALVDRTEEAQAIVDTTAALADATGAEIHLVHALDFPADPALRRLVDAERALRAYHQEQRGLAEGELRALLKSDDRFAVHILEGWVGRVVPKLVAHLDADLAILASTSRSGLATLLGTTAEDILNRSVVSAWVLRPEGWSSPLKAQGASLEGGETSRGST